MKITDLEVKTYWLSKPDQYRREEVLTQVPNFEGTLWAIRSDGSVLNCDGEWEFEPMPSSRDEDFMARCRFKTPEEALSAYALQEKIREARQNK